MSHREPHTPHLITMAYYRQKVGFIITLYKYIIYKKYIYNYILYAKVKITFS